MKVYKYDVDGSRWCREGVATKENGALFDTFWQGTSDRHRLSAAEAASAVLVFDTDEYDELPLSPRVSDQWAQYAPADREVIPSQHGLQFRYFVRKGSSPDLATRIENAKRDVEDAESKLRAAESGLRWACEHLASLEAEAAR